MANMEAAKEAKFLEREEKKVEEKKEEKQAEAAAKTEAAAGAKNGAEWKKVANAVSGTAASKKVPEAKKAEEKEEKKREITLERIYSIPLVEAYKKTATGRADMAVSILRKFASRHMKAEGKNVRIANDLNNIIRKRGNCRPLKKVKAKLSKDKEGIVWAESAA